MPRVLNLKNYATSLSVTLPAPSVLRGHEDNVGENAFLPILESLGYSGDDVDRKPTLTHAILRGKKRFPDYGICEYNSRKYGMVTSIKAYGETLSRSMEEEVCGWCGLAGSFYGCLTNGIDLIVIRPTRGVVDWDYLEGIPSKSQLEAELGKGILYSPYDITIAARITEEVSPQTIHSIADHCHSAIRARKGEMVPERLYEFSKLILMRIVDERRYRRGGQRELRMSSAFIEDLRRRGVDVAEYTKRFFFSVRDEIGVFGRGETVELGSGLIEELVGYLDTYPLWSEEIDVLGEIYERFLMKTMTGRELGQYFTPRAIIDAMVRMVDPSKDDKILDPACGTGGFLISAMKYLAKKHNTDKREVARKLYGIDIFEIIVKLSKIDLWLHGNCHENIKRGDSLDPTDAPRFLKNALKNPVEKGFDVILTNPPFGRRGGNAIPIPYLRDLIRKWRREDVEIFRCASEEREELKSIAPQSAFMEICIGALKPRGRLGIVIDNGLLSNPSKEDPILRKIIRRNCVVDAVVGLPKGTFLAYGSNVYPAFLIMHKKHSEEEKQGKIFRAEVKRVGLQSARNVYAEDSDEDLKKVCEVWEGFRSESSR